MIPIRDSIPPHRFPLINYVLIGLCSLAFLIQLQAGRDGALEGEDERIVEQYGMVPLRITRPSEVPTITMQEVVQSGSKIMVREREREIAPAAISPWLTLITCMFLHGGFMHFLGNMWFLHIFGDNVEDRFGHLGYALLYLGTGIVAGLAHLITNPTSAVPTIGASGAIAGVMGAYLVLYPHSRVQAFMPPIFQFVVPAPIFLGIWFVMQTMNGLSSMSQVTGVAWWAHIGGFVAGVVMGLVIRNTNLGNPEVLERRDFGHGRSIDD